MPPATSGVREGLAIAAGVLALTALFAWKQWYEHRNHDHDLSADDANYYARQATRRWAGTTILGLIGAGMLAGSLLDPMANRWAFLAIWLGVGGLVCVLLVLAMIDWVANRSFAIRHLRLLANERRTLLEEEVRRRSTKPDANGHGGSTGF